RSAGDHLWEQRRGEEERPSHVDVEHHVERLDVLLHCRSDCLRSRVVNQHVDLTGLYGQASHGFDVAQVGGDDIGASTLCLDRRDGLRAPFGVAPGDDHAGAVAGEKRGGFPPYSGGCAGYLHPLVLVFSHTLFFLMFVNPSATTDGWEKITPRSQWL